MPRTSVHLDPVVLMDVRLDNFTMDRLVQHVFSRLTKGHGGYVVTPNVDILHQAARDPDLKQLLRQAEVSVADGMPLVWASRLLHRPLAQRVAGSESIAPLCAEAAKLGIPVLFLGGSPGTASQAAAVMRARYQGLQVRSHCPPYGFEHDDAELAEVGAVLAEMGVGLVFCAFGCPKQERLMAQLRRDFPATWFVGCGGTFSMLAGRTPAAPAWMRSHGLEWLHRLRLEPRRLFKRYLIDDMPFVVHLLALCALQGQFERFPKASPPEARKVSKAA